MAKPVLSDPITLRLPVDLLQEIEAIAAASDRTRSWVMVRAMRYYLLNEGAEILEIAQGLRDVKDGKVHDLDVVLSELDRLAEDDAA
ncbi:MULTISPECIES: CopG family ribbon-helix-helix protein [unclassified Rhizobium]|uniref:CopG family ribbon-helix-helix protein n=1 Tax=unclassified Rhizobium TaxID=2613769 RepID=UPI000715ABB5|nr:MULTISPECIES: ribbon-helix-helix protein, CopG family [unclassified Rhizobium]KQS96798.1 CopG family transcriptional regulator [Rhizobium sp. Leaf386]KQT06713.1 CopG family transcriptional regulator [Rhizobium sp. Leaf391]KQT92647.1 CopG family transcriptional regulator [Rhizobium sp. Leaf453]